ncbi:rhomboid family intramembrane serine protease [Candidatus Micrarchaeota archaeon]|nr:rhomboid family intramembrane serine protease [Candidatus Micrarchaeota archaeon]
MFSLSLSNTIIIILVISFAIQQISQDYANTLTFSVLRTFTEPWRLVTAIFLHAHIIHLFANTYSLYLIGNALETKIKKIDLLKIFFIGGIIGYIRQWAFYKLNYSTVILGLGSSGAVSPLLASAGLLMPETKVNVFFIPIKIKYLVIIFYVFEIIAFAIGDTTTDHETHLVTGLFGVIYTRLFLWKQR